MRIMLVTACAGLLVVALGMAGAESPSADKDQALIVAAEETMSCLLGNC
jgi:hypothetical protein